MMIMMMVTIRIIIRSHTVPLMMMTDDDIGQ